MIDAVRIAEQSRDANCIMRMRVGENPNTPAETFATACSAYGINQEGK